jgi:hypothetical protein
LINKANADGKTQLCAEKLSDSMRRDLLQPVCEKLRLEPEVAFELMQSYFCMNPGGLRLLERYVAAIQRAENDIQNYIRDFQGEYARQ